MGKDGSNDPQPISSFSNLDKQSNSPTRIYKQKKAQDLSSGAGQKSENYDQAADSIGKDQNVSKTTVPPLQPTAPQSITQENGGNIDRFEVKPAGVWARASANIIDGLIIGLPFYVFSMAVLYFSDGFNPDTGSMVQFCNGIIAVLAGVGYSVFFLVDKGATPGKVVNGIKVVDSESKNLPSYKQAVIRQVVNTGLGAIPLLGTLYIIMNFFVILSSDEKKGIHDNIAKTKAVIHKKHWLLIKQIGLVVLLLIFYILPGVLLVPKLIGEFENQSGCLTECVQEKLNTNPEANSSILIDDCSRECGFSQLNF